MKNQLTPKASFTTGRFAPSPTGPLHFGSLIAATASYLAAKTAPNGRWLLRIEDVDTQREQQGASKAIIDSLAMFGFEWDEDILYQSGQTEIYDQALAKLSEYTYFCSCTRKELLRQAEPGTYGYIYPGVCRNGINNPDADNLSIRVRTSSDEICFQDQCQPEIFCQNIEKTIGDFIIKRSDGLFAYQLAVVVDDAFQGVNQVVRGADIFDNTPRQIYLQQLLNYPQPYYLHFPVAVTPDGKKLSKQNHSLEISSSKKTETLLDVLNFLGQNPPKRDDFTSLDDVWQWAFKNWQSYKIPKVMTQLSEYR